MILFIGQAAQSHLDREAFQEVDFKAMFCAPLAKWAAEIREADRAFPNMWRARFTRRRSGRPGPAVLSLPEDVLVRAVQRAADAALPEDGADGLARGRASRPCDDHARRASRCWCWAAPDGRASPSPISANMRRDARPSRGDHVPRQATVSTTTHENYVGDMGIGADPALVSADREQRSSHRRRRASGRDDDERLYAASGADAGSRQAGPRPSRSQRAS